MTGVRLFVALDFPEEVRTALVEWQVAALAGLPGLRVVPPESLHVTLCFLGHLDEAEVGVIASVVARSAVDTPAPPAPPALTGCAWLPPRRPRVLAVDMTDPADAIAALQRALSDSLAAGGWYEPERRRYRPHVTVARVRPGGPSRRSLPDPPPALTVPGASVVLFRSHLSPKGARYEALERVSWASRAR